MDKVSIIMPIFNSEKYVQQAIESVLYQTYKNIELILIDDASTDNSYNICQKIKEHDTRIVLKKSVCKGVSNARNYGLSLATGRYIMFIDSDDLYDKYIVEKMVKSITENELVICSFDILDNNGKEVKRNIEYKEEKEDKFIKFLHDNDLFNAVWNKIYIKAVIKNNNINFNVDSSIAEDLEFNLEYFKRINKIKYINENLYKYRYSSTGLSYKYQKDRIIIRKKLYNLEKLVFFEKKYDINLINNEYIKICLAELRQINYQADNQQVKERIEKILVDNERKKELERIKKNGSIIQKMFVFLLSNKIMLYILTKIIAFIKK